MIFSTKYPLFIVAHTEPDGLALVDLENGADKAKGVAIFTDKEGAEEFRDQYHPSFFVGTLPDEPALARLLNALKRTVAEVVFDPYRIRKRTQTITLAEMLEQLQPATQS